MSYLHLREELDNLAIMIKQEIAFTTVSEFARRVGLKQPDVSAWLNGKRKWSYEKLLNIMDKIGGRDAN